MKYISNHLFHILAALVVGIGLSEAWQLRWLCDDAFISFSYGRNLAEGNGLVYQAGEYVEGYSNFLWTVILAFFNYINFSPLVTSQVLGLIFYFLLLVYFYRLERRTRPFSILPIFVIHLAFFYHGWIFATSGLETMMFAFFLTVGLIEWQEKTDRGGVLFLLASITRPEGVLFLGFHFLSNIIHKKISLRTVIPVILFSAFILFRFFYYGDLLPNTFYAKAYRPAYFSQGLYYLLYWFRVYPLYFPILLLSIVWLVRSFLCKEHFYQVLSLFLYMIYVVYVGGDFMAMRFWVPIIPYLSWIVYRMLTDKADSLQITTNLNSNWNRFFHKNLFIMYLYFILSLSVYLNPFQGEWKREPFWHQIGEERRFYENTLSLGTGYDIEALNHFRVAFFGAQAHYIYFMRPAYAWEAESGLTDSHLAKQKLDGPRGRVGHERVATPKGLLERKIELVIADRFPELGLPYIKYQFRNFDWHIFVLMYDAKKMKMLCNRIGWDCSLLYKELKNRNLDIEKDHILWHD